MSKSRIMTLLTVVVSVLALGVDAVWAAELTTEQLVQQMERLQSKVQQLELKVQKLEARQTEALSVEEVDAEQLGEAMPTTLGPAEEHDSAVVSQPAPDAVREEVEKPAEQPVAIDQPTDALPVSPAAEEVADDVTIADIAEDAPAELPSAVAEVETEQSSLPVAIAEESPETSLAVQIPQAEEQAEEGDLIADMEVDALVGDQAEQAEAPETQPVAVEVAAAGEQDSDSMSLDESAETLAVAEDDVTEAIDEDSPTVSQDEPVALVQESEKIELAVPATTQPAAVSSIGLSAIDQVGE
jgi:outer membrane murein-binding lipoprotein Lpp